MQFILSFSVIYILSAIIGQHMHIFTLEPKTIHIQSPTIYTLLIFPYSIIGNQANIHKRGRRLMLSELLFGILNQVILIGTIILQIIPSIPCEVIEISFGRRHRWLDIIVSTYNQKIPLASILALVCIELLILFGEIVIRAIRNAEFRKKLGKGTLFFTIALCCLFLAVLILSILLLF